MAGFDLVDQIMKIILGTAVLLGLLLVLRRVMLWYWKLDRIEKHLSEIAAAMKRAAPSTPTRP